MISRLDHSGKTIKDRRMGTHPAVTRLLLCLCLVVSGEQAKADDIALPVHRFTASCDFYTSETGAPIATANDTLHASIQSSIVDLVEFAKDHQGQATYVEFSIQASNSAGWCMMFDDHLAADLPTGKVPSDIDRAFGLQQHSAEGSRDVFYRLWARTAEMNAGTMSVILPHAPSVPQDGLFVTSKFGAAYHFSGPVILEFSEGNGFNSATLHPLGNSQIFWREIARIARPLE